MSAVELRARKVYDEYHIGSLEQDVQRQLIILMLNNGFNNKPNQEVKYETRNYPEPYTEEELRSRVAEAEEDIFAGRTIPAEEMEKRLEEKYPWLCE